jgi:hypothetical protein
MSETTILDNLNKEVNGSDNLWMQEDGNTGMGVQFRLFSPAVVSKVRVKLYREGWNGFGGPTGHISARFYGTHTNQFRDQNDYAKGLVAESVNTISCEEISSNENGAIVEFEFSAVALDAGIYFLCLWSSDMAMVDPETQNQTGVIRWQGTESAVSNVGYVTFWFSGAEGGARWGSYREWD